MTDTLCENLVQMTQDVQVLSTHYLALGNQIRRATMSEKLNKSKRKRRTLPLLLRQHS